MSSDPYGLGFEVGPIRPPSEANSLLVRVTRNCPWNRCAFCPVYKHGEGYSRRPVAEVHADLDAMHDAYGDAPRTVFLQDADPMLAPPDALVEILERVRARFPNVERVTTYARSRTLARRSVADLERVRAAGLTRVHVGLESGADAVLDLVNKGVTREQQIEGGRRAKAAGFELSLYVMPGLGGRELTDAHADETASALAAIEPDFVRLRSTAVVPGTPLADLEAGGRFTALGESMFVLKILMKNPRLDDVPTRLESDHAMNLLMELRGDLPAARESLLGICDAVLALPPDDQVLFVLGRRVGMLTFFRQFERPGVRRKLVLLRDDAIDEDTDVEALFRSLRLRWI